MSKFRIYRINHQGMVSVSVEEAFDWQTLFSNFAYNGDPIFKVEAVGSTAPENDE